MPASGHPAGCDHHGRDQRRGDRRALQRRDAARVSVTLRRLRHADRRGDAVRHAGGDDDLGVDAGSGGRRRLARRTRRTRQGFARAIETIAADDARRAEMRRRRPRAGEAVHERRVGARDAGGVSADGRFAAAAPPRLTEGCGWRCRAARIAVCACAIRLRWTSACAPRSKRPMRWRRMRRSICSSPATARPRVNCCGASGSTTARRSNASMRRGRTTPSCARRTAPAPAGSWRATTKTRGEMRDRAGGGAPRRRRSAGAAAAAAARAGAHLSRSVDHELRGRLAGVRRDAHRIADGAARLRRSVSGLSARLALRRLRSEDQRGAGGRGPAGQELRHRQPDPRAGARGARHDAGRCRRRGGSCIWRRPTSSWRSPARIESSRRTR